MTYVIGKKNIAEDILLLNKEVLVWMCPLHQASESNSQILAVAITLIEEIRTAIIDDREVENLYTQTNSDYDPWAACVPMAEIVAKLSPKEVETYQNKIARVICWHEFNKDELGDNVTYRTLWWPAMELLIECQQCLQNA